MNEIQQQNLSTVLVFAGGNERENYW